VDPGLLPYIAINFKWIKYLNVRHETFRLPKETEKTFKDRETHNAFLNRTSVLRI
jgi:hypothetical protein